MAQKWSGKSSKRLRHGPGRAQKSSEMVRAEVKKCSEMVREKPPKRLRNGPGRAQKGAEMVRAVAPWNLGPWDLLGPCLQDFGGFRAFLPGVSQIMMLIQTLQDPEVYALGSLWFLVLRRLYDTIGEGLGPKQPKNGLMIRKPKKAQTVREEPKKAQNWSGRSPKSSEIVHKMVG